MNGRKFHLVRAAASTSAVSMPSTWQIAESSFISAMLRSRWVFSMTLAASATLIDDARWMPALTTEPYTLCDDIEGARVLAGDDLGDGLKPVLLVARIDALRRIADGEIAAACQARGFLQHRDAFFLGGAGIDRGLVDNDVAALQRPADDLGGAEQRGEVGLARVVDRRRHRDDEEVGLAQRRPDRVVSVRLPVAEIGGIDLARAILARAQFLDAPGIDIEPDDRRAWPGRRRRRPAAPRNRVRSRRSGGPTAFSRPWLLATLEAVFLSIAAAKMS